MTAHVAACAYDEIMLLMPYNSGTRTGLNCKKWMWKTQDRMSTLTSEFHLSSSSAFHVQHLHLELLGAGGTQTNLCLQQQLHSRLEFHRSQSRSEEFPTIDQCFSRFVLELLR